MGNDYKLIPDENAPVPGVRGLRIINARTLICKYVTNKFNGDCSEIKSKDFYEQKSRFESLIKGENDWLEPEAYLLGAYFAACKYLKKDELPVSAEVISKLLGVNGNNLQSILLQISNENGSSESSMITDMRVKEIVKEIIF